MLAGNADAEPVGQTLKRVAERKVMKRTRFGAVVAALVMTVALSSAAVASADDSLTNGEAGGFTTPDTPVVQEKTVAIEKAIIAANPAETVIYGPAITYTYTVTPATTMTAVTDAQDDHASGEDASALPMSGITTGVVVNGGAAGTAESAAGTLAWTNDLLDASADGTDNTKTFTIDFSDVVFGGQGVYRYAITETASYDGTGVSQGTAGSVRYLDVYVKANDGYTDGSAATDWDIYGYVLLSSNDQNITATNASAWKTNGFVSSDSAAGDADRYQTYNLTITKTVENDGYALANKHQFAFDVAFAGLSGNFQLIAKVENGTGAATATTEHETAAQTINGTAVSGVMKVGGADALVTDGKDGSPLLSNGASITYVGIPAGATATVNETNTPNQVSYTVTIVRDGADIYSGNIAAGAQGGTSTSNTTAVSVNADTTVGVTNNLLLISPTGVALRFAPYFCMLAAGIVFAALALWRRRAGEKD